MEEEPKDIASEPKDIARTKDVSDDLRLPGGFWRFWMYVEILIAALMLGYVCYACFS